MWGWGEEGGSIGVGGGNGARTTRGVGEQSNSGVRYWTTTTTVTSRSGGGGGSGGRSSGRSNSSDRDRGRASRGNINHLTYFNRGGSGSGG